YGSVGRRSRHPGRVFFAHELDVGSGGVNAVDLDFFIQAQLVDGQFYALGEFIPRREDDFDIRIGGKHSLGLVSNGRRYAVVHNAPYSLFSEVVVLHELLPDGITTIERRKASHVYGA